MRWLGNEGGGVAPPPERPSARLLTDPAAATCTTVPGWGAPEGRRPQLPNTHDSESPHTHAVRCLGRPVAAHTDSVAETRPPLRMRRRRRCSGPPSAGGSPSPGEPAAAPWGAPGGAARISRCCAASGESLRRAAGGVAGGGCGV